MATAPKILVYSKSTCPYCHMAKELLRKLNLAFEEINVDTNNALREKLKAENNGYSTVPMIFLNGTFIGGYSELAKLHSTNTLQNYL